jgi:hypothetical protein
VRSSQFDECEIADRKLVVAVFSLAIAKGAETQARLFGTAQTYTQLWRKGHVDGPQMVNALAELIAWLRLVGLAPDANPGLAGFLDSDCLRTVVAEIKAPDCDAKSFTCCARS